MGLKDERAQTRAMLRRLRAFVVAFYDPDALASFGLDVPLPPRRPRLAAVPNDAGPPAEPADAPAPADRPADARAVPTPPTA